MRMVECHRANLNRKLGFHSREEMTTLALNDWHRRPLQLPMLGLNHGVS
jgi:hypothetical protein